MTSEQRRAFEVVTSTFILSFYHDVEYLHSHDGIPTNKDFCCAMSDLREMQGLHIFDTPLHLMLIGPAGSGKSYVLRMMYLYAVGFCELLCYPFTKHTIIFTTTSLQDDSGAHVSILPDVIFSIKTASGHFQTRLFVLDNFNVITDSHFKCINKVLMHRCQTDLTQSVPYRSLPVIFSGDFMQLDVPSPFYDRKTCLDTLVNSFICL